MDANNADAYITLESVIQNKKAAYVLQLHLMSAVACYIFVTWFSNFDD